MTLKLPIPIPTAIDLVFTNMAPTNDNSQTINEMKKNYKKSEDITTDIQTHVLDEYLEFHNTGRYEFYKCESCDGPMLGHLQNKCRHKDPYDERTVKSFENGLKRIPELKRHVADKRQAESQSNVVGETVRKIIAEIEPRERNAENATT